MWSILLVSTVLGLLLTITMTKIQMEAYRAQSKEPDDKGAKLERCAVRLRNVPQGASEEQVMRWLDAMTARIPSRPSSSSIHHIFIPVLGVSQLDVGEGEGMWLGEAFIYYKSPLERERAMAAIERVFNLYQGLASLTHFRWGWHVRQGEWGDRMVMIEEYAPMPGDIQWANLTITTKCRFAWYSGFLAVWALILSCLIGLFYAYLLACSQARETMTGGGALLVQLLLFNPLVCFGIVLVDMLTYLLAWLEAPVLQTEYTRAVLWQSYVVNVFLVGLILLACFPDLFPWKNVMNNVTVPQTCMYVVNFVFTNCFTNQLSTYYNIGPRMAAPFWEYVLWPLWFNQCVRQCWDCCKCCGAHSFVMKQKHSDSTWASPEFELSGRYVGILYILTVGILASPGIPMAIPLTAVALTFQYRSDLHWLMEYCALPQHVGFSEVLSVPRLALSIASTLCLTVVWIAYLWWTRCADRLNSYADLEKQDMKVMPWRLGDMDWAAYGYYAIAPAVCFILWLLYCCGSPIFTRCHSTHTPPPDHIPFIAGPTAALTHGLLAKTISSTRLARKFYKKKYSPWDILDALTPAHRESSDKRDYQVLGDEVGSPTSEEYNSNHLRGFAFGASLDRESTSSLFDWRDSGEGIRLTGSDAPCTLVAGEDEIVQFEEPFFFAFEDAFAEWEASQIVDSSGETQRRCNARHGDRF